jgi:hypothetical protein
VSDLIELRSLPAETPSKAGALLPDRTGFIALVGTIMTGRSCRISWRQRCTRAPAGYAHAASAQSQSTSMKEGMTMELQGRKKAVVARAVGSLLSKLFLVMVMAVAISVTLDGCKCRKIYPDPEIKFDRIDHEGDVRIAVVNWSDYPDELLRKAAELPPCGQNTNSSSIGR